jgi:glucokinase
MQKNFGEETVRTMKTSGKDNYLAAVDIGGTKITVSIAKRSGITVKLYQHARKIGDNRTIPLQVDAMTANACERIGISRDDISAMGVSTCSPFEKGREGLMLVAPNLAGGLARDRSNRPENDWTEIPLEPELSRFYKDLKIGNDCVTAVAAERLFGAGRGEDDLVYVTWSTGIGAGAYVDGRLIMGKNGNAPHLGHIFIAEDGPRCGCGNRGDLESLVSGTAIARDYGGGAGAKEVFAAYRRGEPRAKEIIERAARNFARGLASINAILDTKVFVLGGSVMKDSDILLPLVKDEFFASFPALSRGVDIRLSALDDYLGDIAALSLVMPDEWVHEWQGSQPWKNAPPAINLD